MDLHVRASDRIGLVGRNGAGKTSLLRILAGFEAPDDGQLVTRRDVAVAYLRQEIDPGSSRPVIDEARTALEPLRKLEREVEALEAEMARRGERGDPVAADLAARYDAARTRFERAGGFEAEARLRATLSGLGLGPDRWDLPLSTQSGGWLMRVELAKLLVAQPEVLLLDEPTNHLDLPSIRWFEGVLASYPGAVVVVSHDRTFLDRHSTRIAELEHERCVVYKGNYGDYLEQKEARREEREARNRNLDRRITEVRRFVDRFGAKASKAAQARSRKKLLEKLEAERGAVSRGGKRIALRLPPAPRSGDVVLRFEDVHKSYGDTHVYRGLELEVRRGQRVALVGPNGAGKSTLLRLAAGAIAADSGTIEHGHNVRLAFYAQHQLEVLDAARTVLGELEADATLDQVPRLRGLLGAFLFSGDDVDKRVGVLSGGEKARLALVKLLLRGANVLVLDEPTNHLDIPAREVVTDALSRFDGTLLFISHDRAFINSLADTILEVAPGDGSARATLWPESWDDYVARSEAPAASEPRPSRAQASQPPRPVAPPAKTRGRPRADPQRRARQRSLRQLRARSEELESSIERCEQDLERVRWLSADPATARDGDRMRELVTRLGAGEAELAALYAEWERTSAEIDALEHALAD